MCPGVTARRALFPIHDENETGEHVSITDDEMMADYQIGDWVTYKKINEMVFIRGNADQSTVLRYSGSRVRGRM